MFEEGQLDSWVCGECSGLPLTTFIIGCPVCRGSTHGKFENTYTNENFPSTLTNTYKHLQVLNGTYETGISAKCL